MDTQVNFWVEDELKKEICELRKRFWNEISKNQYLLSQATTIDDYLDHIEMEEK